MRRSLHVASNTLLFNLRMRARKIRNAIRNFTNGAEQHVVLRRMMRRPTRTGPRRAAMVVALSTGVDLRTVFVREHFGSGEKEIIRRGNDRSKLVRVNRAQFVIRYDNILAGQFVHERERPIKHVLRDAALMRIVTNNACQSDVRIAVHIIGESSSRIAVQLRQPRSARVASAATLDAVRGVHVFDDLKMTARFPFLESRLLRTHVAAAAKFAGDLDSRPHREIVRVRRVIGSRTVAVFTLHPG